METGNVVAATADGTNDAHAMEMADVGFAMGISGTELVKAASDVIMCDESCRSMF